MDSIVIKIALVVAGLGILAGLFIGNPGKGPRGGIIVIAIVIAAAFIIAAVDHFTR
jgi:hypothetical protein